MEEIKYAIFGYCPDMQGGIYCEPLEFYDTQEQAFSAMLTARSRMIQKEGEAYKRLGSVMVMERWPLFVAPCLK